MVAELYQHYKGGLYQVLSFCGLHTETGEELVIYKSMQGRYFARPRKMFDEKVNVDGKEVPRFKPLGSVNLY